MKVAYNLLSDLPTWYIENFGRTVSEEFGEPEKRELYILEICHKNHIDLLQVPVL